MISIDRLGGWTPFRAAFHDQAMWIDWCHLGARRMVEPFHFETIVDAMRDPFNLAFQQSTEIEILNQLPPGVPVTGLIFHMSRCGSTLVSQALASMESTIVVAEATPLRTVLRAHSVGRATFEQAAEWFRILVNAYSQRRFSAEKRLVVKFMAGDVLDIALVRRAFPAVPWIFVTRDPAEILASQAQSGGIDLMRGQIPAARLGLADDAMWRMNGLAYKALVLAAFAREGLAAHDHRKGLILDYAELPTAIWTKVAPHFGLSLDASEIDRMRAVGLRHSKRPNEAFVPERDPSRTGAATFRPIADTICGPVMASLAALRLVTAQPALSRRPERSED